MFVTGVKNQEAAAIRYEDIKIIEGHPYMSIINSISRKTRIIKFGSVIKGSYCQTPYLAINKAADVGVHVERNNLYDYWKPYYDELKHRGRS